MISNYDLSKGHDLQMIARAVNNGKLEQAMAIALLKACEEQQVLYPLHERRLREAKAALREALKPDSAAGPAGMPSDADIAPSAFQDAFSLIDAAQRSGLDTRLAEGERSVDLLGPGEAVERFAPIFSSCQPAIILALKIRTWQCPYLLPLDLNIIPWEFQICRAFTWVDIPIHKGCSTRRDCANCGRFIMFTRWYGVDSFDLSQYLKPAS